MPPTSKAAVCERSRPPAGPSASVPRYGPASAFLVDTSDDEEDAPATPKREFRLDCLQQTSEIWTKLDQIPRASDSIICVEGMPPTVVTFLTMGRDFCRSAPTLGINAATKKEDS